MLYGHLHSTLDRPPTRWSAWSCVVLSGVVCISTPGLAGANAAAAVEAPAVLAQIQTLDRFEAEQERLRQIMGSRPATYVDRVMEEGIDGDNLADMAPAPPPPMGLRSGLVESRLGWTAQDASGQSARHETELGLRLEYRLETLNHGEWSLQVDNHKQSTNTASTPSAFAAEHDDRAQRVTLRNQGFPVTPFVFADTAVGDISSEVTDGLSRGQRVSLGSSTVRGASMRLFGRGFDFRIGLGERGQLTGSPYPGYERTQGDLAWAGYTHSLSPLLYAAVQTSVASQVPQPFTAIGADTAFGARTTSVAATVGHGHSLQQDGDVRARLTLLKSAHRLDTGESSRAHGVYVEGGLQSGRFRHEAGIHGTQPDLRFGDRIVAMGGRGVFWRMDHSDNALSWGAGMDHEHQPASNALGSAFTRSGVNANWQHRINRNNSWGGYLQHSLQRSESAEGEDGARSSYGSVFYQTRWRHAGDSRLRLTVRRNQALVSNAPSATGEELEWEQDWLRQPVGGRLNDLLRTTIGWARDRSVGAAQIYPTAGLTWQTWLQPDWNLSTSLRYTSRTGNLATSRGLSGALQTEKYLTKGWTLGGSLLLNQAVVNIDGAGLLPGTALVSRSNDKTALLFLRYEAEQGQPYGFGLRGAQGAGAGGIRGVVFLDANRDGIQQADEPGVPGVEVFLNQRSRAVTDERGHYRFTLVPTGPQRLSLRPESVPLPWGEGPQSQSSVEVPLRGEAVAPLAVVRVGE